MAPSADRNLLFGILALQMDFISREQLIAGMQSWVLAKEQPLAAHLVAGGALKPEHRQLLEPLVEAHIRQHGNDAQQSLAAVSSVGSLPVELGKLDDAQLAASLGHIGVGPAAHRFVDPPATLPWVSKRTAEQRTRFRILRPHAEGGLGRVLVAEDEELHREVALKEIRPEYADDSDSRARFMLEAEITGGLEHPGIVPVYSLGTYPDGSPFYAMRFVRGKSLRKAIEKFHRTGPSAGKAANSTERNLELRRLLQRLIDVCQAIHYAHSRGVLHRDLKPGNIMLGKYGETLVVDWGLAKAIAKTNGQPTSDSDGTSSQSSIPDPPLKPASDPASAPTVQGAAVGTPAFMSPEQAQGRLDLLGPASDVFSLGAILYGILTGQPPYCGEDLIRKAQDAEYLRPRAVKRSTPRALEAICLKAMAREPAARYATPEELATDLDRWLADEPTTASSETIGDAIRRLHHRYPVRLILWILGFVGALFVLNTYASGFFGVDPIAEWSNNRGSSFEAFWGRTFPQIAAYLYSAGVVGVFATAATILGSSFAFLAGKLCSRLHSISGEALRGLAANVGYGCMLLVILAVVMNFWSMGRDRFGILVSSVCLGIPTAIWVLFLLRRLSLSSFLATAFFIASMAFSIEAASWSWQYPGRYELFSRRERLAGLPRVKGLMPVLGGYDAAIHDFEQANRSRRWSASRARVRQGEEWRKWGDYARAVVEFNEALKLDETNADALDRIAWLRATCVDDKFRDGQLAVEAATKALKVVNNTRDASNYLYTLAAAHAEAGDFASAVEVQTKAIKKDFFYHPGDPLNRPGDPVSRGKPSRLALYESGQPLRDDGTLTSFGIRAQW